MIVTVEITKKDINTNEYTVTKGFGEWQDHCLSYQESDKTFMKIQVTNDGLDCIRFSEAEVSFDLMKDQKTNMFVSNNAGPVKLELYTHDLKVLEDQITVDYEVSGLFGQSERFLFNWCWQELNDE